MMKIPTSSWAHRTLRPLGRYRDVRDFSGLADQYRWPGEQLVGVYENPAGVHPSTVVICEEAIHLLDLDTDQRVVFDEIRGITAPPKQSDGTITVCTVRGSPVRLPVRGRNQQFEDVFEFARFLRRIVEHRNHQRSNPG